MTCVERGDSMTRFLLKLQSYNFLICCGAYGKLLRWMFAGQHMQNINWLMAFLILSWFVVTIIYIVVRATKSLKLGKATAYGVWVLIMEVSC